MPKKRPVNTRHGLINDPAAYLLACTGREYRREDGYQTDGDFARRQAEYESGKNGKSLPNCTLAAIVNALGYYRAHGFPSIPADPAECYALLRRHVRLFHAPMLGGYPAFLNAPLVRRLWRALGEDVFPAVYPLPSAKTMRRQIERGEPLVLSLWSPVYRGHTVLLLGWELWTDGRTPRLFWIVRDGWRRAPRYLDAQGAFIYQMIRMVK